MIIISELKTGWLSPNGDFYPCRTYEHIGTAQKILKDDNANLADEKLYSLGFVSITISQLIRKEWHIYWKNFLTEQQKNFLKPYFEVNTFPVGAATKIRWDKESL